LSFFGIGVILASFQQFGNIPDLSDKLNSLIKSSTKLSLYDLRTIDGMPSGPLDLLVSSFLIYSIRSTFFKSNILRTHVDFSIFLRTGFCPGKVEFFRKFEANISAFSCAVIYKFPCSSFNEGVFDLQ
jgi:hypothetical protein